MGLLSDLLKAFFRRKGAVPGAEEPVSERLLEQRWRNRVLEVLHGLANGDDDVHEAGAVEYFATFYHFLPGDPNSVLDSSVLTPAEVVALDAVRRIMDEAVEATPKKMTEAELIATGWPGRIGEVARAAYLVFAERGRFDEDVDEEAPSRPAFPLDP